MYRELFEIILFYQTLWAQAGAGRQGAVLAGMGTAGVLLAALAWVLLRYSVRLPIGAFFKATSGLLVLMAIVFVGHGVAALQEAGVLGVTPAGSFTFGLVGIHPTWQGLGAQAAIVSIVAAAWLRRERVPAS